jgi:hypothetical protein
MGSDPHERERTRRELALILRRACARLIAEAALLRAGWSPLGFLAPELVAPPPAPGAERAAVRSAVRAWSARAREMLELLHPGEPVARRLARLLATPVAGWPKASRLARLALRLAPSERLRLVLAQAWLAEGLCARARRVLAGIVARDPERAVLARAYAGLGAAHASEGNDRLAGVAYWTASALPGGGAEPLVDGLFLALALGEITRACEARERLDRIAATDPASLSDLRASLQRLGRRRDLRVDAAPHGAALALARAFAERSAGPSALVARMFLGGPA